ncbi:hypothetical protein [Paraliobacillus sediminis]|uniref:hypothetical protein n=1 Tax=Paraliobacillus sediminis TaxID=1885916 RepID=UPI000E3E53E7|nr:hypothetical protein [Paraliobacillus sediminis]
MQFFSTFENTVYLEMALSILEKEGIIQERIFAVPLDNRKEKRKVFDTIHRSDGTSMIDIGFALATAFAVIGASIGFKLAWGPIFWGLIGAFSGFILGLLIRVFTEVFLKKKRRLLKGKHGEVIIIVDCEEKDEDLVESILWNHYALGIAKVK